MKSKHILNFLILAFTIPLCCWSQETSSGGIYGYTSIDYDQVSNTITAYSETDVDPDLLPYYEATIGLYVLDNQGNYQWPFANQYNGDAAAYSETEQYYANSGQTYTAYGIHSATVVQYTYDYYYNTYYYWDPFDFMSFASEDLSDSSMAGTGAATRDENGPEMREDLGIRRREKADPYLVP